MSVCVCTHVYNVSRTIWLSESSKLGQNAMADIDDFIGLAGYIRHTAVPRRALSAEAMGVLIDACSITLQAGRKGPSAHWNNTSYLQNMRYEDVNMCVSSAFLCGGMSVEMGMYGMYV